MLTYHILSNHIKPARECCKKCLVLSGLDLGFSGVKNEFKACYSLSPAPLAGCFDALR